MERLRASLAVRRLAPRFARDCSTSNGGAVATAFRFDICFIWLKIAAFLLFKAYSHLQVMSSLGGLKERESLCFLLFKADHTHCADRPRASPLPSPTRSVAAPATSESVCRWRRRLSSSARE